MVAQQTNFVRYVSLAERCNSLALSTIWIVNKLFNKASTQGKPGIILNYHSVDNSDWRFSTPITNFTEQIEYLSKNYQIEPLSKTITTNSTDNQVSLTFDDSYADIYDNVFPLLEKIGLTATMFVLGDNIAVDKNSLGNEKKLLSIEQIKRLHRAGWEVGFHSVSHRDLTTLTNKEIEEEIVTGKKNLEKKLGFSLRYFAYPFGNYDQRVVEAVKKAGFEAAFTTDAGMIKQTRGNFLFPRLPLEGRITLAQFKANITNLGIRYTQLYIKVLQIKEIVTRRIYERQ